MTKQTIEVRQVAKGSQFNSSAPYTVLGTIKRKLRAEQIGNFNPIFCEYKGNKRVLVRSKMGDISDPFRADKTYLEKLFIRVEV